MSAWRDAIGEESQKDYYKKLSRFVNQEYDEKMVFPDKENIMKALDLTPPSAIKCVNLGQDPYHEPGQAMGLAFSVNDGVKIPPSLVNIYKELQIEYGWRTLPETGNLTEWAKQGVLLLNTVLTVEAHKAASHGGRGWEQFTDAVIRHINTLDQPIVFLLWGNFARAKKALLNNPNHLVLESVHPSPLSAHRGFIGCGHFKKCNEFLEAHGVEEIDWSKH